MKQVYFDICLIWYSEFKFYFSKLCTYVCKYFFTSVTDAAGVGNKPTVAQMELRLIQSKADIESPKITFTATQLS